MAGYLFFCSVYAERRRHGVYDSTFYSGNSKTSGIAALVIGAFPNAKNFQFIHNEIHQCATGVWQKGGPWIWNTANSGATILTYEVDGWSDPNEVISHNLSESDNNIPLNDTGAMNISNASVQVPVGNKWYLAFGRGVGGTKVCNTTGAGNPALLSGSLYSLSSADFAKFVMAQNVHNSIFGDGTSSIPSFLMKSTGALFLERGVFYAPGDVIDGLSTASGGAQSLTPCEVNSWCGMEGIFEVTGTDTPEGIRCKVSGEDSGKIDQFYVSARDSSGNETLLRGGFRILLVVGPLRWTQTTI
jgi:hypothetical protein